MASGSDKGRCGSCTFRADTGVCTNPHLAPYDHEVELGQRATPRGFAPGSVYYAAPPRVDVDFGCVHWTNPNYECQQQWRAFVLYLDTHHATEARILRDSAGFTQSYELRFRGRAYTHCPFCGVALLPVSGKIETTYDRHP